MTPRFSFTGSWVVDAQVDAVHDVLADLERYPEWWPQVLAVARIDDDHARVLCRSRLPYTLDLVLTAVHREARLLEIRLDGDLAGVARWRLEDLGGATRLEFTQDVEIARGPLRAAARVLRPAMAWNHARMMAGCLEGLRARLGG